MKLSRLSQSEAAAFLCPFARGTSWASVSAGRLTVFLVSRPAISVSRLVCYRLPACFRLFFCRYGPAGREVFASALQLTE